MGKLSGGQRAQVALALILAKQPRLLLLDEPVAALDPLARRNFLALLTDGVAAGGLTVVLSSHLVADLERVCDHLIMLASSRVQLCGDIDDLLAEHQVLTGPRKDTTAIERSHRVVQVTRTPRQTTLLVRLNGPVTDPAFEASDVSLEELVLAYMGRGRPASPRPPDRDRRRRNDLARLAPAPRPVPRRRRPAGRVRRPDRDHRRAGGGSVPCGPGRVRREPGLPAAWAGCSSAATRWASWSSRRWARRSWSGCSGAPRWWPPRPRPAPPSSPGCRASPASAGSRSRSAGCCWPRRSGAASSRPW